MNLENKLIDLLIDSPKANEIYNYAIKLEKDSNFNIKNDLQNLTGIWELRWSTSSSPLLSYSPLINNLQILDPINSIGLNLLKPRGIKSIIGSGIIAELKPLNDIKIGVKFTYAGLIGPKFRRTKIKALAEIKKDQKGWLDITYLSDNLRICRGDKGTLFTLVRRNNDKLFTKFEEFMKKV